MIPCPSCGTRNRRGSKYCYRCGQLLDIVFDVSCPACDRLNPRGSAFCAFCGVKLAVSFSPGEPAVAERPAQMVQEPHERVPKNAEPTATPQRELPPWLYEQPVGHPEAAALPSDVPSPSAAEPLPEQSKYLNDIPGALPQTQGWLSSVPKPEVKPTVTQAPQSKAKTRKGCLTLVLPVLLAAVGLILMSGM